MDLLFDVALLKAAQLKKTFKKSKLESRKLHASGSGNGVGSKSKDENPKSSNQTMMKKNMKKSMYVLLIDEFIDNDEEYEELYKGLSYTAKFEKKAKDERKRYIDLVEKSVNKCPSMKKSKSQFLNLTKGSIGLRRPLDKDLFESYGKVYSLKRVREDKDKDEDPPAGSDQGLKKRKTSKGVEPSRGSKSKESKSSSSKGSKSQPKSSGKSAQVMRLS
ncbi:hypothetical protein Tco_0523564 [Tanacetum coccineum]